MHSISTRPEGFRYVLDWWLRMEKYKLTTHQALLRLDLLNLIVSKVAPVQKRTREYVPLAPLRPSCTLL
jgi:hypothetical protein